MALGDQVKLRSPFECSFNFILTPISQLSSTPLSENVFKEVSQIEFQIRHSARYTWFNRQCTRILRSGGQAEHRVSPLRLPFLCSPCKITSSFNQEHLRRCYTKLEAASLTLLVKSAMKVWMWFILLGKWVNISSIPYYHYIVLISMLCR